jgi:hypothetical protein
MEILSASRESPWLFEKISMIIWENFHDCAKYIFLKKQPINCLSVPREPRCLEKINTKNMNDYIKKKHIELLLVSKEAWQVFFAKFNSHGKDVG